MDRYCFKIKIKQVLNLHFCGLNLRSNEIPFALIKSEVECEIEVESDENCKVFRLDLRLKFQNSLWMRINKN